MTTTETKPDPRAERRVTEFRAQLVRMTESGRARLADARAVRRYERLLRQPEAAAYLGCSIKMLWYWRRHGGGPTYYRIAGLHVGYALADLDEFRERSRVEPENAKKSPKRA